MSIARTVFLKFKPGFSTKEITLEDGTTSTIVTPKKDWQCMDRNKKYIQLLKQGKEPVILKQLQDGNKGYFLFEDRFKAYQFILSLPESKRTYYVYIPDDKPVMFYLDIDKGNEIKEPKWIDHPTYNWCDTWESIQFFVNHTYKRYFELDSTRHNWTETPSHLHWNNEIIAFTCESDKILSEHAHWAKGRPALEFKNRSHLRGFLNLIRQDVELAYNFKIDVPEEEKYIYRDHAYRLFNGTNHLIDSNGAGEQWRLPLCCKPGKGILRLDSNFHDLKSNEGGLNELTELHLLDIGNPVIYQDQLSLITRTPLEVKKEHLSTSKKQKKTPSYQQKTLPQRKNIEEQNPILEQILKYNNLTGTLHFIGQRDDGTYEFTIHPFPDKGRFCSLPFHDRTHHSLTATLFVHQDGKVYYHCLANNNNGDLTHKKGKFLNGTFDINALIDQKKKHEKKEKKDQMKDKKEKRKQEEIKEDQNEPPTKKAKIEEEGRNFFDESEFCWIDFDDKYRSHTFGSRMEIDIALLQDLPKVAALFVGIKDQDRILVKTASPATVKLLTIEEHVQKTFCKEREWKDGIMVTTWLNKKKSDLSVFYTTMDSEGKTSRHEVKLSRWLYLNEHKMKRFSSMTTDPTPVLNPRTFNLYVGAISQIYPTMSVEEAEAHPGVQKLLDYIALVLCGSYNRHEDKEVEDYTTFKTWPESKQKYYYLLAFIRALIEEPWYHPQVCFFFYSILQGTGKNFIWKWIAYCILGSHLFFQTQGLDRIVSDFNEQLEGKKLIVIDELPNKKGKQAIQTEEDFNRFKVHLREPKICIHAKYGVPHNATHTAGYVFTANGLNIYSEPGDRTFNVFQVSDAKLGKYNEAYWIDMHNVEGDVFTRDCGNVFRTYLAKSYKFRRTGDSTNKTGHGINLSFPIENAERKKIISECVPECVLFLNYIKQIRLAFKDTQQGKEWEQKCQQDPSLVQLWIDGNGKVRRGHTKSPEHIRPYQQAFCIQVKHLAEQCNKKFGSKYTARSFGHDVAPFVGKVMRLGKSCIVLDDISEAVAVHKLNEMDLNPLQSQPIGDFSS